MTLHVPSCILHPTVVEFECNVSSLTNNVSSCDRMICSCIYIEFLDALIQSRTDCAVVMHDCRAYMIVVGQYDYATAITRASQLTYHSLQGHLVTLTSLAEYRFLFWTLNARQVWLAMTDSDSEGTWMHAAGPEIGTPVTWSSGYGPQVNRMATRTLWSTLVSRASRLSVQSSFL